MRRALVEEKEESLETAQSEARQAKKNAKALSRELREVTAALELKVGALQGENAALEADLRELKKAWRQVAEKNEQLAKQLKAEKKLVRTLRARAEEERAAEVRDGAVDEAVSSPGSVALAEESDAIRALQVQLDSISRQVRLFAVSSLFFCAAPPVAASSLLFCAAPHPPLCCLFAGFRVAALR